MRKKAYLLVLIIFGIFVAVGVTSLSKNSPQTVVPPKQLTKPKIYFPYQKPTIPVKRSYLTFLVGDSIIAALGKNANQLRLDLIAYYPTHEFVNYNYGFSSTNILSVTNRLNSQTLDQGETFPPIIEQTFDLIIFESFAYNPLSQFPLAEGLKKQIEILDQSIKSIIDRHPGSVVAIMTPIAPSEKYFAKGVYDLKPEVRRQWVQERVAYIQNAINYAQNNHIPLINVYERSLTSDGQANLKYINPSDYIHPSKEGIKLISLTIADYIFQNRIFPQ